MQIIPAIIAKNFDELQKKVKLVESYVEWAQIDIMDGKFAPQITWNNPPDLKKLKTALNLEAHLMVLEPEKEIEKWLASGVKRILAHFEATEQLPEIIIKIKNAGLETGVVLNLQTPIEVLEKFQVSGFKIQVIQLMGIAQIGYHGQPFDERTISKIKSLRQKYDSVKIAVDGGVNLENASEIIKAGADILVVGNAIFNSDNIGRTIEKFKTLRGNPDLN